MLFRSHDVLHPTYKAACIALDLMENDAMWIETMTEACGSYSSHACRVLFIFLLLECSPAEPRIMYDQFLDHMKSDFYIQQLQHDGYNEQEAIRYSTNDFLCHIQLGLNECA